MATETGFEGLRNAVIAAQVDSGGTLNYQETGVVISGLLLKVLVVRYESGNEYLRLDRLIDNLNKAGTVTVFEYRGRGVANEIPSIVADVTIGTDKFQLIYRLA